MRTENKETLMKRNNFTLIELMVVVGVMGLLMAISMPQFTKLIAGNKLNRATSKLGSALSYARTHAISKRREVTVRIFTATGGSVVKAYRVEYLNKSDGKVYDLDSGKEVGANVSAAASNTVDCKLIDGPVKFSAAIACTFKPSGKLSTGAFTVNVVNTKDATDKNTITVNQFTGKVTYP